MNKATPTTVVRLKAVGWERDTSQITPAEYLALKAKQIREITAIYMGDIGLKKIRGFEKLVNLECVWLNDNELQYINNLDANFRIKALYAHNNKIGSLKGSLGHMKFLETLDLSQNRLRDLEKMLLYLERFHFLRQLNLKGNPCCEEPDYRLQVIHRLPSLRVLDQHVVTDAERFDARTQIGGDIAALTLAFGERAPMPDPSALEKVEERTEMEKRCNAEAERLRRERAQEAEEADSRQFALDPHPAPPRAGTPPPPPGWGRAGPRQDVEPVCAEAPQEHSKQGYMPRDVFCMYSIRHEDPTYDGGVSPNTDGGDIDAADARASQSVRKSLRKNVLMI